MTQVFDEKGVLIPVTVIKVEDNYVIGRRTPEKNGYAALVLAAGAQKPKRINKPVTGQFTAGVEPKRFIRESRDAEEDWEPGHKVGVEYFSGTRMVDIIGASKGKGYQGVMKRHGFGGGRKTHGSKFHRENGGTGMSSTPARTFKGVRMAGRMGGDRKTVLNLKVVKIDPELQVLLVKGAVPGTRDSVVLVREAVKG
jgi:large subunit ribosomal protein L3